MTLQIGRAGTNGLTLPDPLSWTNNNGTITLTGTIQQSTVANALVQRDQLLGYNDNADEPIVPVIVSSESRLTGYYRILAVDVTTDPTALAVGYMPFTVIMRGVPGYAQPLMESTINGALLTNVVGGVGSDMMPIQFPPSVTFAGGQSEYFNNGGGTYALGRTTADQISGSLVLLFGYWGGSASASAHWYVPPATYYIGGCTFSQGATLQPVTGRMMVQPDLTHWSLSNGLVRVSWPGSTGLLVESFDKVGAWVPKTYILSDAGVSTPLSGVVSVTVLRNSPEQAIVRLGMSGTTSPGGRVYLDLSIRRGDELVRTYLASDIAQTWRWSLSAAEAGTAIAYGAVTAGGIGSTAGVVSNGTTMKYVMLSYQRATASDLVNGRLTGPAATSMDWAVGMSVSGDSSAIDLAKQYLAAQDETVRIISR